MQNFAAYSLFCGSCNVSLNVDDHVDDGGDHGDGDGDGSDHDGDDGDHDDDGGSDCHLIENLAAHFDHFMRSKLQKNI